MGLRRQAVYVGLLFSVAFTAGFLTTGPFLDGPGDAPPIVVASVDPLRADHIRDDTDRNLTPEIDRFLSDATYYPNAFTVHSWTAPVLSTVLTGRYPNETGVIDVNSRICPEQDTLAEQLSRAGYTTAAWTGGGNAGSRYGFDAGFDEFHETGYRYTIRNSRAPQLIPSSVYRWLELARPEQFFILTQGFDLHMPYLVPDSEPVRFGSGHDGFYTNWDPLNDRYWELQRENETDMRPIDLWLRNLSVSPQDSPPIAEEDLDPRRERYLQDMYDNQVHYVDREVGRLMDALRRHGVYDEALIIFYSHHGEELGDHGEYGHGQIYNEVMNVPLAVKYPGRSTGRTVQEQVSIRDIYPTVLRAAGLPADSGTPLQQADDTGTESIIYAETDWERAIVSDGMKLIINRTDGSTELYNLSADPGETTDISDGSPELVASLRADISSRFDRSSSERCRIAR